MKFILAILALSAAAFAQRVQVTFPNPGQNISAGTSINVQVAEGVRLPHSMFLIFNLNSYLFSRTN